MFAKVSPPNLLGLAEVSTSLLRVHPTLQRIKFGPVNVYIGYQLIINCKTFPCPNTIANESHMTLLVDLPNTVRTNIDRSVTPLSKTTDAP